LRPAVLSSSRWRSTLSRWALSLTWWLPHLPLMP